MAPTPGRTDEPKGPSVANLGCIALDADRVEKVLRTELGAVGPPWQGLSVQLRCRGLDYAITIARREPAAQLEQGLFAEDDPDLDRERWIATVILDLAESEFGLIRPAMPRRGALAPAWSLKKPRANTPTDPVKPAPTLQEWLGPAHVGLRLGWRALNLGDFVPFGKDEGALGISGVDVVGARVLQPRYSVFAKLGFSRSDQRAAGADLNLTLFHLGGGVTWRTPLGKTWMFETDLGAALFSTKLTRRAPGTAEILDDRSGIAEAATLSLLLVSYYESSRIGFGLDTGWLMGAPESDGGPFQSRGMDALAKPLSINGPWMGLVFHIGSAETRR